MAQLNRVEVHFTDNDGIERTITVQAKGTRKPKRTTAIFLHGDEANHLKGFKSADVKHIKDAPTGALEGDVEQAIAGSGLQSVCYLINGSLFCWMPDEE